MKRKVKLTGSIASEEFILKPGDVVELDAEVAEAWIEAGNCVAVDEPAEPKTKKNGK